MSLASKIVLAASIVFTTATVGYVHYKQHYDRERLHDGVVKDIERQQRKKIENLFMLQQQAELTKQLREMERQSSSSLQNE